MMGVSFETLYKLFVNVITILNKVIFMKYHPYINEYGNIWKSLCDIIVRLSCLDTSKAQNYT